MVRQFASHGSRAVAIKLFENELLSEERYQEVCSESVSERKAEIMATGLREKVSAEKKDFQKLISVLKELDMLPAGKTW